MRESNTFSIQGFTDGKPFNPERYVASDTTEVMVLKDTDIFEQFIASTHDALEAHWTSVHPSTALPVTAEDLLKYSYTAVKSRVSRVRNESYRFRCDDQWVVPTILSSVLSQLGRVHVERPVLSLLPKWDTSNDDRTIIAREEFELISRKMRALERTPGTSFVFAKALPGDRSGDEVLMRLIPVRDTEGRIIELHTYYEMDAIAAMSYLILGLEPADFDAATLPVHPLMAPYEFIRTDVVRQYLHRLVDLNVGGAKS